MNYVSGMERSQLQVECLDDFINEDNEVRVIDKVIDILDIEDIGFYLGINDEVGRPKFDPRDILKLFIYGYFNGIKSSRKLAKQTEINKELINYLCFIAMRRFWGKGARSLGKNVSKTRSCLPVVS